MSRRRSHSVEFQRQVGQKFLAGETLHGLAKRHDISQNLIGIWTDKNEAGAFKNNSQAADLVQAYEARIAALERLVGEQALDLAGSCGLRRRAVPPASSAHRRQGGCASSGTSAGSSVSISSRLAQVGVRADAAAALAAFRQ